MRYVFVGQVLMRCFHQKLVLTCGFLLPVIVSAEEQSDAVARAAKLQPMATDNLMQTGLGLFLVLALILAVAWVARRMGRFQAGAGSSLKIIGGLSMGSRERIVLIQAGDTQLLVGVAPGRVQTLHVLNETVAGTEPESGPEHPFATSLNTLLKRGQTA